MQTHLPDAEDNERTERLLQRLKTYKDQPTTQMERFRIKDNIYEELEIKE